MNNMPSDVFQPRQISDTISLYPNSWRRLLDSTDVRGVLSKRYNWHRLMRIPVEEEYNTSAAFHFQCSLEGAATQWYNSVVCGVSHGTC